MAGSVMPEINSLGIHAIQMSHSHGKIWVLCSYQKVVMVIQKTKSMAQPIVFLNNIADYLQEYSPVSIIHKILTLAFLREVT
jgi:hypothetical protein